MTTLLYIVVGVIAYVAIAVAFTRTRVWLIDRHWCWSTWIAIKCVNDHSFYPIRSNLRDRRKREQSHVWGAIWPFMIVTGHIGAVIFVIVVCCWLFIAILILIQEVAWIFGKSFLQLIKRLARV